MARRSLGFKFAPRRQSRVLIAATIGTAIQPAYISRRSAVEIDVSMSPVSPRKASSGNLAVSSTLRRFDRSGGNRAYRTILTTHVGIRLVAVSTASDSRTSWTSMNDLRLNRISGQRELPISSVPCSSARRRKTCSHARSGSVISVHRSGEKLSVGKSGITEASLVIPGSSSRESIRDRRRRPILDA
jgi:hypothetical protein